MSMRTSWIKNGRWLAAGMLFLAGALTPPVHAARARMQGDQHSATGMDADQDAQEARDQEQEKRDREQEKREQTQEHADHVQEVYDNGREALDEDRFDRAEEKFDEVAKMNAAQTDAALYWKAYAQNKLGKRDAALATISDLKQRFPQSRWQKDAGALEIEVRQSSGQATKPESQNDDELKMLARFDEQRPRTGHAAAGKGVERFGITEGKIARHVCDGAERFGAIARNTGENRAGAEQSRPAAEGGGIPGAIWRGGVA